MIETIVKLNTTADVVDFNNLVNKCQNEILAYNGRYIVDAKSIMGLYSLDLTKPIKVEFNGDIPDEVKEGMKKFVVN